jgi:hypothetical protein
MVSRFIESAGSSTVLSSIGYKRVTTTKISDMSSKSRCSETDCMVAIDRQFREKDFFFQNFLQPAGELVLRKITPVN